MRHATALTLFLSSLLFLGCSPRKPSAGIYVTLLRRGPNPFPHTTDGDGLYVMTIQAKRVARIRHEEIRFEDLGERIEEVFRTRVERLLLVRVDGQVEFRDVIDALDRASSRVQLQYGLITESSAPTSAEPSLFMDGNLIYTQYFLPTEPIPLSKRVPGRSQ